MHGYRKCDIPISPVGFLWEWELNCLTNGNGTGMGIAQIEMSALIIYLFPFIVIYFPPKSVFDLVDL